MTQAELSHLMQRATECLNFVCKFFSSVDLPVSHYTEDSSLLLDDHCYDRITNLDSDYESDQ